MPTTWNRKRKSSSDHSAASHENGLRRSLRLISAGRSRHEAQFSPSPSSTTTTTSTSLSLFSQPSPSPRPPPAAPPNRRRGAKVASSRNVECKHHAVSPFPEDAQQKVFSFFSFPGEIRNAIYDYALHYPDSRKLYAQYYRRPASNKTSPTWKPRFRAPTILLLNKRITNECLPVLKSTTLVIDRLPPPRHIPDNYRHTRPYDSHAGEPHFHHFMRLSDFISPRTLQSIPQININVGLREGPLGSGWAWKPVVDELISILAQRNACVKLRLLIRMCDTRYYPNVAQKDMGYQIYFLRRLKKFANVNPNVFARREVKVDVWKIEGQMAMYVSARSFPEPVLVLEDGEVYVLDRSENESIPAPRMYPDKEMFPGSVLEFVTAASPPYYSHDDSD